MNTIEAARKAVKLAEKIEALEKAVTHLGRAAMDVLVTIRLSNGIHLDLEPDDVTLFTDVLKKKIAANRSVLTTLGFE